MERHSAVCFVPREDDKILVVWNRRYHGWTLPGGLVEPYDTTPRQAALRELWEEARGAADWIEEMYKGPADPDKVEPHRATYVHVFRVRLVRGCEPHEVEHGCPIDWMTLAEYLERVPFKVFYRKMCAEIGIQ